MEFDNDKLGGDFVIVKGNGGAIFYLANTVDDLDERITHVLRAEEHLPNTPKNQLLWQALGPRRTTAAGLGPPAHAGQRGSARSCRSAGTRSPWSPSATRAI